MLLYGYTRVSAIKQDLRLQRVVLKCNLCVSPGL